MTTVLAEYVQRHLLKQLKKKKNFVGFDGILRPRIKNGVEVPDTKVLRVYVSKKEPVERLSARDLIPRTLPLQIDGLVFGSIETDIVEIGEIRALTCAVDSESIPDPKARYRPVCTGISSTHYQSTACTTNAFFRDKETGKILLGYNNHCAARENKARIGDSILQPSPYDGGRYPTDEIGKLYRFIPIEFEHYNCPFRETLYKLIRLFRQPKPNEVDIAFVELSVPYENKVLNGERCRGKRIPMLGERVWKIGRTTGYTEGTVASTHWNGYVWYTRGKAYFTNCILIQGDRFSQGGDSGSAVYTYGDNYYIGALFAGSDTHTIVCKYDRIEALGGVELLVE